MKEAQLIFDIENREQLLAYELISKTNKCVFITGKAGTGKTTFIKRIQQEIHKNFLVLAPTGIAAIAAGGQTIHSFFGFPMEIIGPHTQLQISHTNEKLLKYIDSIIIDEASMLRCDMVDGMDRYLRIAFHNNMPFGGKQVIFIGDLFQLPPVVKKGTVHAAMLNDLYGHGTPFFYKAKVLRKINLPKIEFMKIYRQEDDKFVEILNKMRIGEINTQDLSKLSQNIKNNNKIGDYAVILTGFNRMAKKINEKKLESIDGKEVVYHGIKNGLFNPEDCPAPEQLKLKVGAQVIFCRNDYYAKCANGTIAKVINLEDNMIHVQLENGKKVTVERVVWKSFERYYDCKTREIKSEVVGTYTQFPIKLAWAITIHKSQGMTFDKMHFDLSWGTFAPGQAYVAISRMRSLQGLSLSHRLMPHHIIVNPEIKAFSNSFNNINMIKDELETGTIIYNFLSTNNYDMATQSLLKIVLAKIKQNDYRNAALVAKQLFDIMLDDNHLMGTTINFKIIQDYNLTCCFLNSILCLYGMKYKEAIGYADLVLSHRKCIEAMFIKARAFYELGIYHEASNLIFEIIASSNDDENKKALDKKLFLLEAKINNSIGNPNIPLCKRLIQICPTCVQAYILIRKEMRLEKKLLSGNENNHNPFIKNFDDESIDDSLFLEKFVKLDPKSSEFKEFNNAIKEIA